MTTLRIVLTWVLAALALSSMLLAPLLLIGCVDTTFGRSPDGAMWYSGNRKLAISEREAEVEDGDFKIRARAKDDISPELVKMLGELRQAIESLKTAPALPALPSREPKPMERAGSR